MENKFNENKMDKIMDLFDQPWAHEGLSVSDVRDTLKDNFDVIFALMKEINIERKMGLEFDVYPYGSEGENLKLAKEWLSNNVAVCLEQYKKDVVFDASEFYGLPLEVANKLTGEEVDFLQEQLMTNFEVFLEDEKSKKINPPKMR